jgi:hypothetical protein|uniref:Uncharacterized protein n=1 Tax=viral metagenome TaxID=1070528 RepID=A0A6C0DSA0_9ZZZZ
MDDFNVGSLHESKNEWGARLLTIMTPLIIEGFKSIFEEANKLCRENNETDKYLMTFQNFVSRIPKWNPTIIENERKRICDRSGCGYLEDLVTCVHIIQLKLLTAMRAGNKQKKIDINIPKLDDFIHKTYIHVARKVYKNVYLFEIDIPPLQMQKNHRELEVIVQECILNAVRESIPVENILRAYMDESVEEDVVEEIKEQFIETPKEKEENEINTKVEELIVKQEAGRLSFNNVDLVKDSNNNVEVVNAPKDVDVLEQISVLRNEQRRLESSEDDDSNERLQISEQSVDLGPMDVHVIDPPGVELLPDLLIDDIEVLV